MCERKERGATSLRLPFLQIMNQSEKETHTTSGLREEKERGEKGKEVSSRVGLGDSLLHTKGICE